MTEYFDFFLTLLAQFAGGPGPIENNLMRFGIPAVLWGILWIIAWVRQRQQDLPREKWLVWGFGLGFFRELFMFSHIAGQMLWGLEEQLGHFTAEPLEQASSVASIVVIAAAFLRYMLDDTRLPRRYLLTILTATGTCFLVTFWWWPDYILIHPQVKFHQTWAAWAFHLISAISIVTALVIMSRKTGWLRNAVTVALVFFFLSELRVLLNFATARAYQYFLCPIGNSLYTLGIATLGYVYIRELFIERRQAENALKNYRDHLEELVEQRTVELTGANTQLQAEITERRRMEEALRESEARFRRVISSISDHIYMTEITDDGERINRYISPNVAELTGYPAEIFMEDWNFWPSQVIHPDDRPIAAAHALHLPLDQQSEIEYRLVRADGQTVWVRDSARVEAKDDSKIVFGVVGDITERKQAEMALEKLSRYNQLILNSAGEGIFGVDVEGKHTFVNRAAAEMLGFKAEELIDRPSHATWHHSKADGSPYLEANCPLHAGYESGTPCRGEDQVFWRKDGTAFPARYFSTPIFEKGQLTGAVVVFQDITERKQAEAEIAQRNAQLAAQYRIAATISRSLDLNTILNTALNTILEMLAIELGAIYLLEPDSGELILEVYQGVSSEKSFESIQRFRPGEHFLGLAVINMHPFLRNIPVRASKRFHPIIATENICTAAGIPLISQGQGVGLLFLGAQRAKAISPQELELLASIGQQIGVAVQNARLYQVTERWVEELSFLHHVSLELNSTLDPAEIYNQIAAQSVKLLGRGVSTVFTWDMADQEAVGIAAYGLTGGEIEDLRISLDDCSLFLELITHRQSIPIEDFQRDARVRHSCRERFRAKAMLCVPIWSTTKPLAFLFLMDPDETRPWRSNEIKLVESFVNRAAVALENAILHEQVERAATLEERQRIAAEMHDGLAQTLSYLGHRVDQAALLVESGQAQEFTEEYDQIRQIIDQAAREVRLSIASLQKEPEPRQSLQDRLAEIVAEFIESGHPPTNLLIDDLPPLFLPTEQLEQVVRVVQESLTNVSRHAQAQTVSICLEAQPETVAIAIEDDGRGFDPDRIPADGRDHFGLRIMRARAARLGGRVEVDSRPGHGTRIILTWPLEVSKPPPKTDQGEPADIRKRTISTVLQPSKE